jgi:hypothetical protein
MMRGSAIILLGLMASLLIVVGLALAMPSMDDFDLDNPGWNGLSKFKSMVEPNSGLEGLNPVDSVLFLIGPSKPFSEADVSAFKMFLMEGGLVVLMDDYGSGNDLLAALNLSARFINVELRDPLFRGKDSRLVKIVDVKASPYTLNVSSLIFNCATALDGVREGEVLAYSTPFSYLDGNGNGLPDEGEPRGPFPVMAEIEYGEGVLILISDSSLFINSMMDENYVLLRGLEADKRVFIDVLHWEPSKLTLFKADLGRAYDFIKAYEVKYTLLALLAILPFKLKWKGEKGGELKKVLKAHPEWNKELLKKLEEERR